jgi:hypothetical protein
MLEVEAQELEGDVEALIQGNFFCTKHDEVSHLSEYFCKHFEICLSEHLYVIGGHLL